MLILVDAMGGDNAPEAVVNGSIDAVYAEEGFDITLIGDSEKIKEIIARRKYEGTRINIHHTTEVIDCDDIPTKAIKTKKDSSMVVGFKMIKEGKGDVFVSAGNSGALMAGALLILGRIKGIDRPSFPAILPTKTGRTLLIDAGLNTVCKPINYLQFGIMGSIYMKELFNIENPKVGLINVGSEDSKGNEIIKQAFNMLSESSLNFTGNIEGKDIPMGNVDVAVCDGFVGNVVLKFLEGCASFFLGSLKQVFMANLATKISAMVIKSKLKLFMKRLDPDEEGGAPILGVNGLVIKSHGSSNAKAIKNVIIRRAYSLAKTDIMDQIRNQFKNMEVAEIGQNE